MKKIVLAPNPYRDRGLVLTNRAKELLERLHPLLPGTMAIISREIGSGVVPMTPEERNWRELHGQVLQALANRADRVFRIFCGLPEVLK